jgi:hypothetical protein
MAIVRSPWSLVENAAPAKVMALIYQVRHHDESATHSAAVGYA